MSRHDLGRGMALGVAEQRARMAVKHGHDLAGELGILLAAYDARGAAIEQVRALHTKSEDGPYCTTCGPAYHTICCDETAWPCDTIQALDGPS